MTQNKTLKTILIILLLVGLLFSCKSKTPENNENPSTNNNASSEYNYPEIAKYATYINNLFAADDNLIGFWWDCSDIVVRKELTAHQEVIDGIIVNNTYFIPGIKGRKVNVSFYRDGIPQTVAIQLNSEGKIGAYQKDYSSEVKTIHKDYGFFESIPKGISQGVSTLVSYVKQFKYVFSKEGATQIGGFGAIGSLFPSVWDWHLFWNMTAFLSIILAFMNILPIPALDGGHVMFTLWEMITRRKPSEKFMERAQMVGMILLFALLIYANGNDLFRWLTGKF